jgi:hypothetical protein
MPRAGTVPEALTSRCNQLILTMAQRRFCVSEGKMVSPWKFVSLRLSLHLRLVKHK